MIGTYVVCRRMFLAGGITHSSFGGLGIAFYLGTDPIAGAMISPYLGAGHRMGRQQGPHPRRFGHRHHLVGGHGPSARFMSLRPGYTSGDLSAYLLAASSP
ncbi:MAG: metal ABC transporter permease [Alistipes sp.]